MFLFIQMLNAHENIQFSAFLPPCSMTWAISNIAIITSVWKKETIQTIDIQLVMLLAACVSAIKF